jgi:hypothetical protein
MRKSPSYAKYFPPGQGLKDGDNQGYQHVSIPDCKASGAQTFCLRIGDKRVDGLAGTIHSA